MNDLSPCESVWDASRRLKMVHCRPCHLTWTIVGYTGIQGECPPHVGNCARYSICNAMIVRYAENLPKGEFTEAIRHLEGRRLPKTIGDPRTEGGASWNGSYCPVSGPYCSVDISIARHLELTPCIAPIPVKVNNDCLIYASHFRADLRHNPRRRPAGY
jgi:hypothetical protein